MDHDHQDERDMIEAVAAAESRRQTLPSEPPSAQRLDFASLLGADAPDFERCACGQLSTRVPCFECLRREEAVARDRDEDVARGIPPRFRWARATSPELARRVHVVPSRWYANATECAARLAASDVVAALLVGPAGSGKTSLAVAAMRSVPGSFFIKAERLERARIEHRAGDGEAPLVARAMRAPLLVLDDLGQDKPSAVSAVEAVILARHDAELRTWVTTGLDAGSTGDHFPEIEGRYNAGVARRITQKGVARVIRFTLGGA